MPPTPPAAKVSDVAIGFTNKTTQISNALSKSLPLAPKKISLVNRKSPSLLMQFLIVPTPSPYSDGNI